MFFTVIKKFSSPPANAKNQAFLKWDDWDDYNFQTVFHLIFVDDKFNRHNIGALRIGFLGQKKGERNIAIGDSFEELNSNSFSLGGDTSYYRSLNNFGDDIRVRILSGLRDIAFDSDLYVTAILEAVTDAALLRGVSSSTVTGQYRRMAHGGDELTDYRFSFTKNTDSHVVQAPKLSFKVVPESNPPTNIHVLIGRNGVGKTNLIIAMLKDLYNGHSEDVTTGFSFNEKGEKFVNVVYVSFSAFDSSMLLYNGVSPHTDLYFRYIGLRSQLHLNQSSTTLKTEEQLIDEFLRSFKECKSSFKSNRLRQTLKILDSDRNFSDANILQLLDVDKDIEFDRKGRNIFKQLSSGHKIILLSITKLIETIQEKSLVFIDEPEAHLHPPLLSAFTRALSDLLIYKNAVAIIATHSPVILQEVPNSCVWKLSRFGATAKAERLEIESFGENVGILTREVFGLEVTESGFYKLLKKAVADCEDYDEVLAHFNEQLGFEARSLTRSLFAIKNYIQ